MTTFDGWDARALGCGPTGGHSRNETGGTQMLIHGRDTRGWVMTYGSELQHGSTFGRGHYRGDYSADTLYGSRGYVLRSELAMAGPDTLAHFRTKGSKNGVRRYQQPDGTWTPLGLRERRIREGFGERRAARKEARAKRREEKAAAKAAERSRRAEELAKFNEKRRLSNPKTMTDEELRKGIERKKMEQEYRELNRNPLLKTAGNLVQNYMKNKAEAEKAKERQYQNETNRIRAMAEYNKAKAERQKAKSDMVDSLTGAKRMEAKAGLLKQKTEWTKHTISGAIRQSVHDILSKSGNRLVREMSDSSLLMRGGRKVKNAAQKSVSAGKNFVQFQLNKEKSTDDWVQENVVGPNSRGRHER